jgi:glycosyltransferase involved in cell wall biosynthesis
VNDKITVIILTYNEELHIKRCIDSVIEFADRVVLVDSISTDNTKLIAMSYDIDFYENKFINQAQQFEWAINNCDVDSKWILRIDADEIIDSKLAFNIKKFVEHNGYEKNGAILNRRHIFLGKWIKYGGRYPLPMLRLFRNGCAHIEQRWMDEHIVLDAGTTVSLEGGFYDHNLNSITWFIDKHNKYATREVVDIMLRRLYPELDPEISKSTGLNIRFKRFLKQGIYLKFPYFLRPFLYFIFRFFIQLGFLDGARGFAYHFMQGFWYRALVDLKCMELEILWNNCSDNNSKLVELENFSGCELSEYKE